MNDAPSITVRNAQRKLRVDLPGLRQFAARALSLCLRLRVARGTKLGPLDVILVSDRRMAALHREFMNIPGPTDVITFQHGEIFISVETAQRHARRFGTSRAHELRLYLVHGILHLLGFDDTTPAQAQIMASTQQKILAAAR